MWTRDTDHVTNDRGVGGDIASMDAEVSGGVVFCSAAEHYISIRIVKIWVSVRCIHICEDGDGSESQPLPTKTRPTRAINFASRSAQGLIFRAVVYPFIPPTINILLSLGVARNIDSSQSERTEDFRPIHISPCRLVASKRREGLSTYMPPMRHDTTLFVHAKSDIDDAVGFNSRSSTGVKVAAVGSKTSNPCTPNFVRYNRISLSVSPSSNCSKLGVH